MFKIYNGKDVTGKVDDNESELRPMDLTARRILNASGLRNAMLNNCQSHQNTTGKNEKDCIKSNEVRWENF